MGAENTFVKTSQQSLTKLTKKMTYVLDPSSKEHLSRDIKNWYIGL